MPAAKKSASKSSAVARAEDIVNQQMKDIQDRIAQTGGQFVKLLKSHEFELPDGSRNEGPLTGVIVDFVSRNMYYRKPYKEGEITAPDCFAIGRVIRTMQPSSNAPDPQADNCQECPMNMFDSNPNGRGGKACQNQRVLAVMSPDPDEDSPILLIKVPPKSLKNFDSYVATVSRLYSTSPMGVITDISFDESQDTQVLKFGNPRKNPNIDKHVARLAEASSTIEAEPDLTVSTNEGAPKKRAAGKKAAAKRGKTLR